MDGGASLATFIAYACNGSERRLQQQLSAHVRSIDCVYRCADLLLALSMFSVLAMYAVLLLPLLSLSVHSRPFVSLVPYVVVSRSLSA